MIERLRIRFLRRVFNAIVAIKWWGKRAAGVEVQERRIEGEGGGIGLRIFTPQGPAAAPRPLMLFIHGGGFIGGDVLSHDPLCRDLCVATGHVVVSVDYRLAPEHPFPAAPMDCLAALDWVRAHAGSLGAREDRIVLCGDSAGGNLAAVAAIAARSRHPGLIKAQVLIYPVTDHYSGEHPSVTEFATGHGLTRKGLIWLWDTYLEGSKALVPGQVSHDLATPLRVQDLGGLPPALVLLAEFDPLRDEGLAYVRRLEAAGVATSSTLYPGEEHGFVGAAGPTPSHRRAIAEIADWLRARGLQAA